MVSTMRFVDLVRIYFFLIVSRNHSSRVKYCSDIMILTDLCRLSTTNVYFNDMQITRWQHFKDKGHHFTLNLQMTATKICRISLLRTHLFYFLGLIYFAPSQTFNIEISWNFDIVQKIFSHFYPIFHDLF